MINSVYVFVLCGLFYCYYKLLVHRIETTRHHPMIGPSIFSFQNGAQNSTWLIAIIGFRLDLNLVHCVANVNGTKYRIKVICSLQRCAFTLLFSFGGILHLAQAELRLDDTLICNKRYVAISVEIVY